MSARNAKPPSRPNTAKTNAQEYLKTQNAPSEDLVAAALREERLRAAQQLAEQLRSSQERAVEDAHELRASNQALAEAQRQMEAVFRRQMAESDAGAVALRMGADDLRAELDVERSGALHREAAFAAAAEAAAAALQAKLDEARAVSASLHEFAARRTELEIEAERVAADAAAARATHRQQVQELEARVAELEEAMSSGSCLGGNGSGDPGGSAAAVAVREPEDAAGGSSGDAGGGSEADGDDAALSADLWRLLESNRKMAGQMRAYSQETDVLQRELAGLEAERARLLREAALARGLEALAARRGSQRAREIRDAHARIGELENGLARLAAERDAERSAHVSSLQQQLAAASAEAARAARCAALRERELRHARRLARRLLAQRGEAEEFLVSTLYEVRSKKQLQDGGSLAPALGLASAGEAEAEAGESAAPTGGLTLEERERVLRALFAAMNRGLGAAVELPEHPLQKGQQEPCG